MQNIIKCTLLAILLPLLSQGQKQSVKVIAIGSYNCENLFDPQDDTAKKDEDFTPGGAYTYTYDVYKAKLHNVATVIQQIGTDVTPDGAAVVGLVEIENDKVLAELVKQPEIAARHYQYIWFPTSDERGISTAMLYNPKYMKLLAAEPLRVPLEQLGQTRPTRDILHVTGILAGDTVHFLVNHWPSKSGGEAATNPGRMLAAKINRKLVDSLYAANPNTKIMLMGDFNDDPTADAFENVLETEEDITRLKDKRLYNPWTKMYKKGMGTESFRGTWHLIDQIIISTSLIQNKNNRWKYYKPEIFNKDFLINKMGKDKGLPHRSFTIAQVWDNGYSDHFPVLVYLISDK